MHQWEDSGIVISVSRYGEQSAIVRLLTAQHGLFPGMAKGAFGKSARGIYQPGNIVHAHWQARLEDQLGHYRCEMTSSCTAQLLHDAQALRVMNAVAAMVLACVPERIKEEVIFSDIRNLLEEINNPDYKKESLFLAYARFEFSLLQELGFGLDLTECVATGGRENLTYISPKSGRAVCAEAGEPYKAKMLPLPPFFLDEKAPADMRQILDALAVTGYFLEGWILQPEGRKMPDARAELLRNIS